MGDLKSGSTSTRRRDTRRRDTSLALAAVLFTVSSMLVPGAVVEAVLDWLKVLFAGDPSAQEIGFAHLDKLVHFSLFFISGLLSGRAWRRQVVIVLLGLLGLAVLTEVLQYYIPGRYASVWDGMANVAGAVVGVVCARWWFKMSTKKGTDLFFV